MTSQAQPFCSVLAAALFALLAVGIGPSASGQGNSSSTDLDFQTEDVQRAAYTGADFLLTFNSTPGNNSNGVLRPQQVLQKPALATLPLEGVSQIHVTLGPCAINQPHVHPRASEFAFIIKGEVFFGFIEENSNAVTKTGGRLLSSVSPAGTTFVVPQGLIHFVINRACTEAQLIASFPTRDPGTQTVVSNLFGAQIPDDVLRATTGLSDADLKAFRNKISVVRNPSADTQCLKRCGLIK